MNSQQAVDAAFGRLDELIDKVESGEPITPAYVRRLETLQALDLARIGFAFSQESIQLERMMDNGDYANPDHPNGTTTPTTPGTDSGGD